MRGADRRIRRTKKLLHQALISLALEKNYDSITVQEILDRADVGRSTFYVHFKSKDELLISGTHELEESLNAAVQGQRSSAKAHDAIVGFSGVMFAHASEYRQVYHALLHTQAWPMFRQHLEHVLEDLIRRESKAEIVRLK